jgi:hypothetical protein
VQTDKIVVGLIVVRGGGSSFYRKNAYRIHGRPILGWAIDILLHAGFISRIFVWTEDEELAEIALEAGATVLERPRDMVHYFSGNYTLGEWHHLQDRQIRESLGCGYEYIVPFNCNCIAFRPESLRAMYETLLSSGPHVFRVQAVCSLPGGLCLVNPQNQRLLPFWNDTEKPLIANPPLYRMVGVGIVDRNMPNFGKIETIYHQVSAREAFDFQHVDDIPFARHYITPPKDAGTKGQDA